MNRTNIINTLFDRYNFKSYLEVGVEYAENNFDKIHCKNKDSVDPNPKGACTYIMTSDKFFETYPDKKYDVIFLDGMQTKEQMYKDATNSMKHLNDGGFIVMHCCDPRHESLTVSYQEYLKRGGCWLGTTYKAFLQLKSELPDWSCFVVGGGWGCGILTSRKIYENRYRRENIDNLSWSSFNKSRSRFLQWVSYKQYYKLISQDIAPFGKINDRYMDLIVDEYKESYLKYKLGESMIPYSTHQPILIHLLNTIKKGDVLEYGMGWNSTPIMHTICGMQGRKLLSVETDKEWFDKFAGYQGDNHNLLHVDCQELSKWNHPLFKEKYVIAFIDGSNNISRQKFIETIKVNVDYFVIHDTEEAVHNFKYPEFTYGWDFSGFKHCYHLQIGGPSASLVSNLEEIDKDLLTIFR